MMMSWQAPPSGWSTNGCWCWGQPRKKRRNVTRIRRLNISSWVSCGAAAAAGLGGVPLTKPITRRLSRHSFSILFFLLLLMGEETTPLHVCSPPPWLVGVPALLDRDFWGRPLWLVWLTFSLLCATTAGLLMLAPLAGRPSSPTRQTATGKRRQRPPLFSTSFLLFLPSWFCFSVLLLLLLLLPFGLDAAKPSTY